MLTNDHQADVESAQEACAGLISGNNEAILPIYRQYHPFLFSFTKRRLNASDTEAANSILTDFWVELLNGDAICGFKGLASLKTYLFKILKFRIIDHIRRENRQGGDQKNISDQDHEIDGFQSEDESPEKTLLDKEKIKLIHESLLLLSDTSPADAYLVKMHLEGLNYNQMAEKMLSGQDAGPKDIDKKVNAIKKQFTRTGSGSLDKFKACLERVMRKNNLMHEDILD